ncbi:MAG TPA: MFS transporter [Haliangiales bacterium]|nr:MFS transporter [Haliangiales bacterium]
MLPIFLIVLVDVFGLTLVIPLLAIYAEKLGATPLQATLLISVFSLCMLVSGPLLGRISDRTGRKKMLLVSQAGTFVGFLLMARAEALWVLYAARVIDGLTAGNLSLAQAWIADRTAPENRTRAFALIGIAFGVGFFVGPAVTGWLSHYALSAPIYLAAAMSLTSILCTTFLLPDDAPTGAPAADGPGGRRLPIFSWGAYAEYFRRPVMAGLLGQFFAFALAFAIFTSGFALFAERTYTWNGRPFSPREIGFVFAYSGFLGIILQGGLIGRLVKRFGDPALVAAGFVGAIAAYTILGATGGVAALVVAATVSSFGNGILRPTLSSLVSQQAGRGEQGVVLGLTQSLMSVAQIVGPLAGGLLLEHGLLGAWALAAAVAALGGLAGVRWGSGRAARAGDVSVEGPQPPRGSHPPRTASG